MGILCVANHWLFANVATPVLGTLREVLDKDTTTRDKNSLNNLGITKVEFGGVSMMLKTVMEVAQD